MTINKGVIVWRCNKCINGGGNKGVVFGYKSEAREMGCHHKLRKQRQFEDIQGRVLWEDIHEARK